MAKTPQPEEDHDRRTIPESPSPLQPGREVEKTIVEPMSQFLPRLRQKPGQKTGDSAESNRRGQSDVQRTLVEPPAQRTPVEPADVMRTLVEQPGGGAFRTLVENPPGTPFAEAASGSSPEPDARQTVFSPPKKVAPKRGKGRSPTSQDTAIPYRPLGRPPMALITAYDDGTTEGGETWRMRRSRFVIGKTSGDLVIPHDADISAEHMEILRQSQGQQFVWLLRDLGSSSGTFVRSPRALLRMGREVQIGSRRYVFQEGGVALSGDGGRGAQAREPGGKTPGPGGMLNNLAQQIVPQLVEQTAGSDGEVYYLRSAPCWLGSDRRQCDHVIENDAFVSAQHARLTKDNQNRWVLEDLNSLNGVWVRIDEIRVERTAEFQLGGQRFQLKIL